MNIFISGITGTLGQTVMRMLMARGHRIIGYSRDEQKQKLLPRFEGLTLYLGDIRDQKRLLEATREADLIMHFAALKMVDVIEENPEEAIETNVIGTQNILHAQRANGIDRVVLASTDKAVYPINAYGASKMLAERLVLRNQANVVCRYGNVLGSRGSILPMLVNSLRNNNTAAITHKSMTRFWITAEKAASFVISSALDTSSGGLKVPDIQSAQVMRVIDAVADHLGITAYSIEDIGIRPGEKIHEDLLSEIEGGPLTSRDKEMSDSELNNLVAEAMRGF